MRVFDIVLQLLIPQVVGLFFRTKNLLLRCDPAVNFKIAVTSFNLSHEGRRQWWFPFSTSRDGTIV